MTSPGRAHLCDQGRVRGVVLGEPLEAAVIVDPPVGVNVGAHPGDQGRDHHQQQQQHRGEEQHLTMQFQESTCSLLQNVKIQIHY